MDSEKDIPMLNLGDISCKRYRNIGTRLNVSQIIFSFIVVGFREKLLKKNRKIIFARVNQLKYFAARQWPASIPPYSINQQA